MLSGATNIARLSILRACQRGQIVRCMGSHTPAGWLTPLEVVNRAGSGINHLPVPEGSWQEDYNKRNSKYNILLAASIIIFALTAGISVQSGATYLHGPLDYKTIDIDPEYVNPSK